ncbi:MAG: DNA-formamidopyrimidine glycosylase [Candidatus Omnitrophica bacterium]|nr:DNA-formamidopyrimidine glycosylase [Candidatus Omnitrophota bacterium]
MPELPEVETIKKELKKVVFGKKILKVIINNAKVIKESSVQSFIREIEGATIKDVIRKGKLLILELSSEKFLCIHLKLTGQLIYPGNPEFSRISFKLSDGKFLDYRDQRLLGELRLVDSWQNLKFIKELGPEPFDLTLEQFKALIQDKKTKIKPLLMDQTVISGIGNLYAAEALFRAKINPTRIANKLDEKEIENLFKEIIAVLKEAIQHKGSSVDQYVRLSGEPGEYVKYHKVYGRQNQPCFICNTPIKRISLGGRGTYFCPKCQK